jgi:plasmid stabilization system protein ParE
MDLPFRSSVREALERIRENPRQYPEVHRGLRRALTHRFPFSIFYRFTGEDILVIAVVHGARHPDTWRRRS